MNDHRHAAMTISVIIPTYRPGDALTHCLEALLSGILVPDQILVVDDGSESPVLSGPADRRVSLVRIPDGPSGPAAARNRGCREASGDVLVFVDSDVAVHPDALSRMEAHFRQDPDLAAVFGSYDDDPPAWDPVSLYKNLLHHYTHHHAREEASTFWAGLGAVRRDVFVAAGGFDERYRRPSIEDIEFGVRMKARGFRIRLDPSIQGKHLKHWSFIRLLLTDMRDRAWPWAKLVLASHRFPNDLNLDTRNRLGVAAVWAALAGFAGSAADLRFLFLGTVGIVLFVGFNIGLLRFFKKHGSHGFVCKAGFLHFLHLAGGSLAFGAGMADFVLRKTANFVFNRRKRKGQSHA